MIQARYNVGGSLIREVADASPTLRQGMCLEFVLEDGVGKVQQSTGAGFAGIAHNEYKAQDRSTMSEDFVAVGATHKVARQAIGGEGTLTDKAAGTAAAATFDTDAQTLTGLTAGTAYNILYAYTPSVTDLYASRHLLGEGTPGFVASDVVNAITVIIAGDVFTDYFDVTVDYSTTVPKAGAAGILGDTGADINAVQVIGLPSPNCPLLGIYFQA